MKLFPTIRYSRDSALGMPNMSLEWDMTDILIWAALVGLLAGLMYTLISKSLWSPSK